MARMTQPTTPAEAIEQGALNPRSVTVGDTSATAQSIPDLIEADRYLASRTAARTPPAGFGIRVQRIKPPGGG